MNRQAGIVVGETVSIFANSIQFDGVVDYIGPLTANVPPGTNQPLPLVIGLKLTAPGPGTYTAGQIIFITFNQIASIG